jgi:predicted membrane channel-forming protein YqfA (hemolysin III family)
MPIQTAPVTADPTAPVTVVVEEEQDNTMWIILAVVGGLAAVGLIAWWVMKNRKGRR